MSIKENCSNCKFNPYGTYCQRFPKHALQLQRGDVVYRWPVAIDTEWCGEYKPNRDVEKQKLMYGV